MDGGKRDIAFSQRVESRHKFRSCNVRLLYDMTNVITVDYPICNETVTCNV